MLRLYDTSYLRAVNLACPNITLYDYIMVNHSSPADNIQPAKITKRTLKILLVDDQKFVQYKLQEMLSSEDDLQIVGTASDGETAIALVESLQPDMVLIDIEMPKMNGIEATQIISQRFPDCKIIILSSHEQQEYVQKIIAAGADGYILKTIETEDLVTAIRSVCKGYSHFGSELFKKIQLAEVDRSGEVTPSQSPGALDDNVDGQLGQKLSSRRAEDLLPPVSKWLTWGGISVIAMVVLAIPASAMFKYKTVVKTQAIARPVEELHLVQSAVEGQIAEILVKEGQEVKQGEAIATIDRSQVETQQNKLTTGIEQQKLQLAQLNAQIASLSSQIIAETERNQAEIAAANSELADSQRNYEDRNAEVTSQVEEFQAQMRAVNATLDAARVKYSRYQSVGKAGAISKERLAEAKLEMERQEQELEVVRAKLKRATAALNPSDAGVKISLSRIEQAKKSGQAAIAGFRREREALIQQRLEIEKQLNQDIAELNQIEKELAKTNVTATATGTIFQLNLRNPQQTVQPGQEIAQIIPQNFKLEMKAAASPQDISKLKVGQEVQMKVSACPYPDYGILTGKVSRIAKDTSKVTQPPKSNGVQQPQASFYEVFITPDEQSFGRQAHQCTLQLGMESQANIISREESVLQFILRKARLTSNL